MSEVKTQTIKDFSELTFTKFIKKPLVVNAHQMQQPFQIHTSEGVMRGKKGDWLIEGINGEMYPCRNAVFHKSFDAVPDRKNWSLMMRFGANKWTRRVSYFVDVVLMLFVGTMLSYSLGWLQ